MSRAILSLALFASACGARPSRESHFEDRPEALVDLEVVAEHAYDRALAGDAAAVTADSSRALDAWTKVRGDVRRRGGDQDLLTEVDEAVLALGSLAGTSTDRIVLGRAANRITGSLDDVFALYDPAVRSSVMELDYLGRELYLDGKADDLRHASTHASLLDARWTEVRAELDADQIAILADSFAAVTAAVTSRDADVIAARADVFIYRVYDLEKAL